MKGKTALVTGSTSGIGLGIARSLAARGVNIVLNGFGDAAEIEKLRAGLAAEHSVTVVYENVDLTRPPEIEALFARLAQAGIGVDILVNNAGIQHVAPIESFPTDRWDAVIALNLSAAFHAIRCAMPGMKARGWGRIVNIASAHGLVASAEKVAYVAAKHGILGMTKSTAKELARFNITANAIAPGAATPMTETIRNDERFKASPGYSPQH